MICVIHTTPHSRPSRRFKGGAHSSTLRSACDAHRRQVNRAMLSDQSLLNPEPHVEDSCQRAAQNLSWFNAREKSDFNGLRHRNLGVNCYHLFCSGQPGWEIVIFPWRSLPGLCLHNHTHAQHPFGILSAFFTLPSSSLSQPVVMYFNLCMFANRPCEPSWAQLHVGRSLGWEETGGEDRGVGRWHEGRTEQELAAMAKRVFKDRKPSIRVVAIWCLVLACRPFCI